MQAPRPFTVLLFLASIAAAAVAVADDQGLAQARGLLLGGKYAEAAEIYGRLAKEHPAAVLGLARCLEAEGKREEAVKTLNAGLGEQATGTAGGNRATLGDRAMLHAELARLAFERGDYEAAKAAADRAVELNAEQLLAWWILGELDRVAGRLDEAEDRYRQLIRYYNSNDVPQAESLHWIGLGAARYARWNRLSDQFSFLVNDLYPDALQAEPDYWPAYCEAGLLFLEKYNRADAAKEFQAALERNPNAAEVHAAMARLSMAEREFKQAENSVARALELNPQCLDAWLGKVDLTWANYKTDEALRLLSAKALPLNPLSERTLGRIAACYVLLDGMPAPGRAGRLDALIGEVNQRNPHAGEFFFVLGSQLEERNKQAEAKYFLEEAVRRMPRLLGPRSQLGMIAMRTGREAEARKILDEAFEVDPFNVRVSNSLSVLEVLDEMATQQAGGVVLKYDQKQDALLAQYAAAYLEREYPHWCRQFGYTPPEKPLLEIFNRSKGVSGQQWFSTRLIGLPYLGVVAACTGRLVAMTSPSEPGLGVEFNWARTIRHEFVHVITLQQTNFNIPHWYTEALAVYCEDRPRPQRWNDILLKRVPKGELFNLDTINFGFTRAQSGDDWQMAYCQAELYVEYMLSRWGSGSLRQLLDAYADGLTTRDAIARVFGLSQEEFEQGYVAYVEELVAGMTQLKYPSSTDFDELLKQQRQSPDDADLAAELALAYLKRQADEEAKELAEKAQALVARHQLAAYVLARLHVAAERTDEAVALLEECLDRDAPQPNALNLLAGLKLKAELYDEAARLYGLGEKFEPLSLKWTKSLARVYLLADNREALHATLARLAEADPDDLSIRKKLAQMAFDRRDFTAAADWANQAVQIDVMDADIHRVLGQALVDLGQFDEAIAELEVAVELKPEDPYRRFALGDACIQAGRLEKAREVLQKLLVLVPDYPGAALLMENIQEMEQP